MPERYFSEIIQNDTLRSLLASEILQNRFPHAHILTGKNGSGKHTFALNIAAALECKNINSLPCGECESCKKIFGGFSPDVIYVKKDDGKKEFSVSIIRDIKEGLYIPPNELSHRVYIIEDADAMNISAQNAFLKILEEPPEYVVFLLICENTVNLLETIKSRATILSTEPVTDNAVLSYLKEHSTRAKELCLTNMQSLNSIVFSAAGSIGRAMYLLEESEAHENICIATNACINAITAPTSSDADMLFEKIPTEYEALGDFLSAFKDALRDLAVLKKCDSASMMYFTDDEAAKEYSSKITLRKILRLIDSVDLIIEKLKLNLDAKLAAVTLCGDIKFIITT